MEGRVLFVDDQQDFLDLLKIRLKDEPYKKFFTSNSKEVLELLENNNIDVIVSDMNMPKNGIDLFKEIKKSHPKIAKIALSGTLNTRTLLMAINEGDVYKYITKPWKVDKEGKNIIREAISYSKISKGKDEEIVSISELKKILIRAKLSVDIIEKSDENNNMDIDDLIEINSKYLLKLNRG